MISMREAYEKIGANYDDACARLMGEEMLARFALKFLDDESMDKLEAAMAAGDARAAFMAAHTLKGVSQNLGFDNLYEPAVVVTEALRGADAVELLQPTEQIESGFLAHATTLQAALVTPHRNER